MGENSLDDRLARVRAVAMDVDGTFTDGTLFYDEDGNVLKGFCAHDGLGLELLRRAGILRGFVTGRSDGATEARARYLGLDFHFSGVGDKAGALRTLTEDFGVSPDEILFIGDDLNDLTAFEAAGVTAAPANASAEIRRIADFVTEASGGRGAVREAVERLLLAKGLDPVALWKSNKDTPVGKQ